MNLRSLGVLALLITPACTSTITSDPEDNAAADSVGSRVHMMPMRNPDGRKIRNQAVSAHLTYYGGPVISNVEVVDVMWGTGVNYQTQLEDYYRTVLQSAYMDWLTEYNTPTQQIGRGSFISTVVHPSPPTASTIDDSLIQSELKRLLGDGTLPANNANRLYMFYFPPGKVITQGGQRSCSYFCAYHGTTTLNGTNVYYGVMPDQGGACASGCGGNPTQFDNTTDTSAHELIEAVTDPAVGLATQVGAPLAWYDTNGGEIGDICAGQGADGKIGNYWVQAEWSNQANKCIVTKGATTNDFSISASPTSKTVTAGSTATVTVSTTSTSGTAESVRFTASGLPTGVTASFSPTSANAGGSSTLTFTAASTAASGTSTVTITGTATSATHTTTVSLTVQGQTQNDFTVAVTPSSRSINAGQSTTYTVNTTATGTAQTVSLTVTGCPSGATCTFSPTSVTAGGSSTLNVSTTSGAATSNSTLTVTGSATSGTHSATATLSVTGATQTNDFGVSLPTTTASVNAGGSTTVTVTTRVVSGTPGSITLSAGSLPSGVTASFSPNPVTPGNPSTLTLSASSTAPAVTAASYSVTGTAGATSHSASGTLTVVNVSNTGPNLIGNGDFEKGNTSSWTTDFGYASAVTKAHHGGSYSGRIGVGTFVFGDSGLYQGFHVPATGHTTVTLWRLARCNDPFQIDENAGFILDPAGNIIDVIYDGCSSDGAWVKQTLDVTQYAGQDVLLYFYTFSNGFFPAYQYVDDVTAKNE